MKEMIPIIGILTVFGSVSFLTWVIVDALRRKAQLRVMSDFHNKLLDRINNGKELAEFMDSPGGTKFIDSISTERTHPAQRILRAVQVGIVLCAAGIGCRVVGWQSTIIEREAAEGFVILGIMLLSIGIGYLVSAAASFGLGRSLGVYSTPGESAR
ncbi:hypothetical protein LuPra_05998 [Luteitalea pratensis]|uniref:Uncharacterized protein n=1 Tax=Luteitalea pratensis TaxID=1855912 RepID=A0A143PWT3_LUTPR|nr:hypothetical protein [Luteitalea pratensis]AMY12716.1 hypothetical protein LuPra_05998 [Luteitalea pratensis]